MRTSPTFMPGMPSSQPLISGLTPIDTSYGRGGVLSSGVEDRTVLEFTDIMNRGLLAWLELGAGSFFEGLVFHAPRGRLGLSLGRGRCELHAASFASFGEGRRDGHSARCRLAQGLSRIGVRRYLREITPLAASPARDQSALRTRERQPDKCLQQFCIRPNLHGKTSNPVEASNR